MAYFHLSSEPDSKLRLKSFSSASRGGKSTISIVIETVDPWELGYALHALAQVQAGQKVRPPKPEPKPKTKPLALPAPRLALPEPE